MAYMKHNLLKEIEMGSKKCPCEEENYYTLYIQR